MISEIEGGEKRVTDKMDELCYSLAALQPWVSKKKDYKGKKGSVLLVTDHVFSCVLGRICRECKCEKVMRRKVECLSLSGNEEVESWELCC